MDANDSDQFIVQACNSTDALRSIYLELKKSKKNYSLGILCRKIGISSTGYLSDILGGRRIIHPKYVDKAASTFGFSDQAKVCFRLLVEIDHERNPVRRADLLLQLKVARNALNVSYRSVDEKHSARDLFLALDVFCSLGILPAPAPIDAIVQIFEGSRPGDSVMASLSLLQEIGIVTIEDDKVLATEELVLFKQKSAAIPPTQFIKVALAHAAESVGDWFSKPEQAYFSSTVLSVKMAEYVNILQAFKSFASSTQSSLESKCGDSLIRFNVQIYPVGIKS